MRNAFWVVRNAQYRLDGTGADCFRRLSVAKGTCESFSKSNIFWLTISHQLAVRFRSAIIGCQAKQPVTNHSPADKILIPGLPGPVVTGAYLCTRGAGGRVLYDPCGRGVLKRERRLCSRAWPLSIWVIAHLPGV